MGFPLRKGCRSLYREDIFRPLTDPCEEFLTRFDAWDSRPYIDFHWSNYKPDIFPDGSGEMTLCWSNLTPIYGDFSVDRPSSPDIVYVTFTAYMGGRAVHGWHAAWSAHLHVGGRTRISQMGVRGCEPSPDDKFYASMASYLKIFTESAK